MKKVLSPFLGIYVSETVSVFSIIERISGVLLFIFYVVSEVLLNIRFEYINDFGYYNIIYMIVKSSGILLSGFTTFMVYVFFYHLIIGLKYIYWNSLTVQDITLDLFERVKVDKFLRGLLYFSILLLIFISF
jgi:succinate dehydrogenase/fumarate reductase cytochrome b subunit